MWTRSNVLMGNIRQDASLGSYLLPNAKNEMVEHGGIGSIRLLPRIIDGTRCWFGTASKNGQCDGGIPLVIPERLLSETGTQWGERVEITGRVRFLQEVGLNEVAATVHDVRPVILFVERITRSGRPPQRTEITPIVLFDTANGNPDFIDRAGYIFVNCEGGQEFSLDEAADWMNRYATKFNGRVLTNFDEQLPRIAEAPLSYQRLINKTYERTVIQQFLGDVAITRIDNVYHEEIHMGHHISVGGDAIINIDSTLTDVTQSIGSARGLDSYQKAELDRMVQSLKEQLDPIKITNPEECQAIADAVKNATSVASKPIEQRKPKMLQLSADGLISAAKTVSEIAPSILNTAGLIAKFVVGLS